MMRVFIADDSSIVVERMVDLLKEVPGVLLVGHAVNVQDSIKSIQLLGPDVVILDLQMPGGTGLDVLRAIRRDRPAIKVVVCTNYPSQQYREECFNNGANYFLDKSTEFQKIPKIFQQLIQQTKENVVVASQYRETTKSR